jgi:TolA-binding protein
MGEISTNKSALVAVGALALMWGAALAGGNNDAKPTDPALRDLERPVSIPEVRGIDLGKHSQVDLVEKLAFHRHKYGTALVALREFYFKNRISEKQRWVEKEIEEYRLIKTYPYLVSDAIPGPHLRPLDIIPEADELFRDGLEYFHNGRGLVPFVNDEKKLKRAINKLRQLIRDHPNSDKIDESAFWIAEIYKEYFNDDQRALVWYERAWQWNPRIDHPARFQAAVIHDFRRHDRRRAFELYHEAIKHEKFNQSNVEFSVRRIQQLAKLDESIGRLEGPKSEARESLGIGSEEKLKSASLPASGAIRGSDSPPQKSSLNERSEVQLVDDIEHHRNEYAAYLVKLINFYHDNGRNFKRTWAERELNDLKRIKAPAYLVDEAAPRPGERPNVSDTRADGLFYEALELYESAHSIPALPDSEKIQRAEEKFLKLIREARHSDKIDDASFYLGEIYSLDLSDDARALTWYKNCWEWNPRTTRPAKYNSAKIYDRLNDRQKAIKLYRQVVEQGQAEETTVRWARQRLDEMAQETGPD